MAAVDLPAALAAGSAPSRRRSLLQRFLNNRMSIAGLVLLGLIAVLVILVPLVPGLDPTGINLAAALHPPTFAHPFGTDALGRDVLARVAFGGQLTVLAGFAGVAAALVLGAGLGMLAAYIGGLFEAATMRVVDLLMAFPSMLLAVIVAAILGVGLDVVVVAICVFMVPNFARLMRATVLSIKERDYIRAALGMGASHAHILWRHVLPNSVGPLAVQTSLNAAWAILSVAWMSFLGFGAQSPTPELGAMISDARGVLFHAPWVSLFPGIEITLIVLALNFIGDGLRDAFDVRGS